MPREKLVPGAFGENLTTAGLLESEVRLGDCFQVGSAVLMAMQPRVPCFKLNIRFDDEQMVRRFQQAGRSGIYFSVVQPGTLQAGDALALVQRSEFAVTIQQVIDNYCLSSGPYWRCLFCGRPCGSGFVPSSPKLQRGKVGKGQFYITACISDTYTCCAKRCLPFRGPLRNRRI